MDNNALTAHSAMTLQDAVANAEYFINKSYLDQLSDESPIPLNEDEKKFSYIRLYQIEKIVYDKDENVIDKLISIYAALGQFSNNVALVITGNSRRAKLYLGIRSRRDVGVAGKILNDSFIANFPGSRLNAVKDVKSLLTGVTDYEEDDFSESGFSVECVSVTPSLRGDKKETFIQGLEKFIDAMRHEEYTCVILATPLTRDEIDSRRRGLEEISSALSPFLKTTLAQGQNNTFTLSEGVTNSVSTSISNGISLATGTTSGYSKGKQSGFNLGASFLVNFGFNNGTSESVNSGTTDTQTETENTTQQEGHGIQITRASSEGTSETSTTEYKNKSVEELIKKIDLNLKRLTEGESYGLWDCAAYIIAAEKKTVAIASGTFKSLMLGENSNSDRSHTNFIRAEQKESTKIILESLRYLEHPRFLYPSNGMIEQKIRPTNTVSGKELPIILSIPRKSLPGVVVSEMSSFGRNVLTDTLGRRIQLGKIHYMDHTEKSAVDIDVDSLTAHCFITGSTGSGKSNTVYTLLDKLANLDEPVPFLVIEPAKGEYKKHFGGLSGLNVYGTNLSYGQLLKINPFRFPSEIHVLEHLDRLIEIFNACWEMYAAMPAILKEGIERAYISKGWDLLNSVYTKTGSPAFPTFNDLLIEIPKVIAESSYSADTRGDYTGALVTRVHSLTNGLYGQIFCDDFDIDDKDLYDGNTIIDLSRVGSTETKSLIMGMIVLRLTEYRMSSEIPMNASLRHITVLEEAHNLLKNTSNVKGTAGNQVVAKSVEMIVNSIAEMRTYGEGFFIVDQSPTSVDIAAIKNTNTKIVMRLPEKDDCDLVGRSVSLNDGQISELSRLNVGIAVVMQSNWTEAVLAKVDKADTKYEFIESPLAYANMKEFRSVVLTALLEEYALSDKYDVERILKVIDDFDIRPVIKKGMKQTIRSLCGALNEHFDSLLLGRHLMRIAGCADAFRISAKHLKLKKATDDPKAKGTYTDESVKHWRTSVTDTLAKYVDLDSKCRNIFIQYMIHAQRFERHDAVDYDALYHRIYGIR